MKRLKVFRSRKKLIGEVTITLSKNSRAIRNKFRGADYGQLQTTCSYLIAHVIHKRISPDRFCCGFIRLKRYECSHLTTDLDLKYNFNALNNLKKKMEKYHAFLRKELFLFIT